MRKQLFYLFAALLLAASVHAVLMTPLSIEKMAARADLIVQGKVLSKTAQRDEQGRIFTKVEVQVLDVWKGAVTNSPLVFVHGGGSLGEEKAEVGGQAEYAIGEELALFLILNERREPVTIGLAQGKFIIETNGQGEKHARNIFHGGTADTARVTTSSAATSSALPLSELKRRARVLPQ